MSGREEEREGVRERGKRERRGEKNGLKQMDDMAEKHSEHTVVYVSMSMKDSC